MTFRTPKQAIDGFRDRMGAVVGCVTSHPLVAVSRPSGTQALGFRGADRFVRIQASQPLLLSILHLVEVVPSDDGRFRVSTRQYSYDLQRERETANKPKVVIQFHYQPEPPSSVYTEEERERWVRHPHLHVETGLDLVTRKTHTPTGRVSLESFVRLLIGEIGVIAARADWSEILEREEAAFRSI